MKKVLWVLVLFLVLDLVCWGEIIEKIKIEGNQKVSRDTVLFYMKSKENSDFSDEQLKRDFKTLWETGFFADISIDSQDGTNGKIVVITVKENPLISAVTYKTGRKIKQKDIEDKLKEQNLSLLSFSHFNPAKVKRVEKVIRDMLVEKGYNAGQVTITPQEEKGDQVALSVQVVQGPKTRIGVIDFPGLDKKKVPAGFLERGIKTNKPHRLFSWVLNKDTYKEDKIAEDLEEIKLRLQQKGYLEAKVGTPSLSFINKKHIFGGLRKMMKITVPLEMGPLYRLGEIRFEGNKVLKTEALRTFINMKRGKVFNMKKRNKMRDEILKTYSSAGYFYCQIIPQENLDPVKGVADLTVRIVENDVVYLGKLEFIGNNFTKDHVIRREWFLREGNRLNINALEDSIRRMKQLGLVTIEKMPDIKPNPQDPQQIDLKVEVQELNRNMLNFNVGYSGYDGWFVAFGYSTQNFLGLGETFALNLQTGTRSKNYQLAFTEPRLFDSFASLGVDVHRTSYEYPGLYTRFAEGFTVSTGARFWKYWGTSLIYSFENIEVSNVNEELEWNNPYSYFYYTEGKRTISAFSPTLYYSTVDSPLFPTSGIRYLLNYRYSGGFLGGDINLHKYKFEFVKFLPVFKKRHIIGFQAVYQGMSSFGGKDIPFYEKYFLGGEQSIRGFDVYRIGSKDVSGYVIGGSRAFFMNLEYRIPMSQQFSFVFFYDVGNSYNGKIDLSDRYESMGVELMVYVPMLGVPFRLIFAYNPRLIDVDDSHFAFRFGIGPSF